MPKSVRQVIAVLEAHGWTMVRQRGSHRHYRHPSRRAIITVAGKPSDTIKRGTLPDIRRKSGLEDLR
jgi:predicted RNA binding protein YcfA (HicA-like mRNA interferase family)